MKFCLVGVIALVLPLRAFAQSALEVPQVNSVQNGIGLVSGWKCTAGNLTATFNNSQPFTVIYGSPRADTQSVCSHINTGFALLWNWNLLGDGQHTVRVFDDGVEFASATFRVITPGVEFLTKNATTITVADFPRTGEKTTLQWQESTQSFVMVAKSAAEVRDVEGEYEYTGTQTSNTCSFGAGQQLDATFRLRQDGSAIRATSAIEGGIQLLGEIEPGQEFSLFSLPEVTSPTSGCTQRRTFNLDGDFGANIINFVYDYQFIGTCPASTCRLVFSGPWTKEEPFPFGLQQGASHVDPNQLLRTPPAIPPRPLTPEP
ncbi:MAG: hypothetical protein AB7G75_18960 [Candidatus Binatia bacterium]